MIKEIRYFIKTKACMDREKVTFEEYYLSRNLWIQVEKCRGGEVCVTCARLCMCVWVCVCMCVSCQEHCVEEIIEFMSTSKSI